MVTQPMDETPPLRAAEDFEAFFRREYRPVLGLAAALTGSRAAAEELTQDAFMAALRRWDRVAALDNPGAWVRRVVANRSVSAFRRRMAEARALLRWGRPHEAAAIEHEARIDLWREVRRLPARQAQAVAVTYLLDLTRREVAEVLGCSEETVKTHLDRARRTLAGRLTAPEEAR